MELDLAPFPRASALNRSGDDFESPYQFTSTANNKRHFRHRGSTEPNGGRKNDDKSTMFLSVASLILVTDCAVSKGDEPDRLLVCVWTWGIQPGALLLFPLGFRSSLHDVSPTHHQEVELSGLRPRPRPLTADPNSPQCSVKRQVYYLETSDSVNETERCETSRYISQTKGGKSPLRRLYVKPQHEPTAHKSTQSGRGKERSR